MRHGHALIALALGACATAHAQDPQWEVVLASDAPAVAVPGSPPAASFSADGGRLASEGSGAFSAELWTGATQRLSLWQSHAHGLQPFAEPGVTGPTGPNRTGAEKHHVFRSLQGLPDATIGGTWVFSGRAGTLDNPGTLGVWLHSHSSNREIARVESDGPLGPGLGTGWVFVDFSPLSDYEPELHALPDGGALLRSDVRGPGSGWRLDALNRYEPGTGMRTCALQGSDEPMLAPGITGAGQFASIADRINVAGTGEIIAHARTTGGGQGLWIVCRSAPSPRAYTDTVGTLGPRLADPDARFTWIDARVAPAAAGTFYFSAGGRLSSSPDGEAFGGVFKSTADGNIPVLLTGTEGELGPKLPGHVFVGAGAVAAGRHVVALATIEQDSIRRTGLWRLTADAGPQPIAIEGDTGAYAPAAGSVWSDFAYWSLSDNGDVIVFASTDSSSGSLWRLRPGVPPQQILKPGDPIAVPTARGIVHAPLSGFGLVWQLGNGWPGFDFWSSTHGSVLIEGVVAGFSGQNGARTWIRGGPSHPDRLFASGFDD